jgi:hypothetical protein
MFYNIDPWSGDLYNLSATFLTGLKYHFIRFGHNSDVVGSAKFVATISSRWKYKLSSSRAFVSGQAFRHVPNHDCNLQLKKKARVFSLASLFSLV